MGKTGAAFVVISAILALCCSTTVAGREIADGVSIGRELLMIPSLDEVRASCQSTASVVLFVTGGTGQASAGTVCSAYAAAISDIERVWEEYLDFIDSVPPNACVVAELERVVQICARAIASVYTAAYVDIVIDGTGVGCASAYSQGDSYARAFAALFVRLWVGITDGPTSAEADAWFGTLEFAIASAWAQSEASVCQINSGSTSDYDAAYAVQVTEAIACVWAEVIAGICRVRLEDYAVNNPCDVCGNGELDAYLTTTIANAQGEVCSSTRTVVDQSSGNASTGPTGRVQACQGRRATCCTNRFAQSTMCLCGSNCRLTRDDTSNPIWSSRRDPSSRCSCVDAADLAG